MAKLTEQQIADLQKADHGQLFTELKLSGEVTIDDVYELMEIEEYKGRDAVVEMLMDVLNIFTLKQLCWEIR